MLHLHGSGFLNSRDLSCKFGNIQVQAEYASESEIRKLMLGLLDGAF